ncbi:flagellar hook-associated protein 3 FlgL [Sphingomonas guangdongensis]|uniref:Flagellar hook-associated protein 3 FlgL n=1 Tax=Sphingomonas guangdongensis TaxID=1141890 RepID=A0A285QFE7_9SPHN|nr:flagellar hook-associated protein FlgL [Sphingomonas guangdongensis]SOB80214.1 flagellar hook-associated protein 3 FlgL [Sphingomonas guangdongensis]
MRVATSLTYDRLRDRMGALSARADQLNNQLATNKRIQTPSDDAAGYRALSLLKRTGADAQAELTNIDLATSLLEASSTALGSIEAQLVRVREISVSAGSATLSPDQKTALATELDVIVEDLLRIANTSDSRGGPLFSGTSVQPPYERVNGTVTYTGVGEAGAIPIGDGRSINATTSGAAIFNAIPVSAGGTQDMFAIIEGMADNLRNDVAVGDAGRDVQAILNSVTNARASIGARGARLELEESRLTDLALTREEARSAIEDTDVTATITELQKTLTVLQATQASFSKLTSLSLFDYLR